MSIFETQPITTPTLAQRAVTSIVETAREGLEQLKRNYLLGFDYLWKSEATPDEILEELGINGREIIKISRLSVQTILTANPNALAPDQFMPPRNFIEHEDGTLSLEPPPEGYDAWGNLISE